MSGDAADVVSEGRLGSEAEDADIAEVPWVGARVGLHEVESQLVLFLRFGDIHVGVKGGENGGGIEEELEEVVEAIVDILAALLAGVASLVAGDTPVGGAFVTDDDRDAIEVEDEVDGVASVGLFDAEVELDQVVVALGYVDFAGGGLQCLVLGESFLAECGRGGEEGQGDEDELHL